jgi:hypothetical protein
MRYELDKDYEKLLETCDEATQAFQNRKINRRFAFFQFDIYKIICNIQFGNYFEAERIADSYFKIMTSGVLNWFVLKIYIMVSRIHSKDYQRAYEIMHELRMDKGYNKLPGTVSQTLRVYEAHVELLVALKKIRPHQHSKFRLHKFLNEIPIFTKDKRGLNVAILIVHVLFLLEQRKYSQIIDRVDALNQYCHRHLRRDDTFRSNCFIKMLLQIPRADFNRRRIERYADPYLTKLKSMPLMVSEQTIEVEVIPYEHLWKIAIEMLE